MQVKDIMSPNPITLLPTNTLQQAAEVFTKHKIDGAPVVDEKGEIVGIVTKTHLLQAICRETPVNTLVSEVMRKSVAVLDADFPMEGVCKQVNMVRIGRFPVVDEGGKLVGMVTRTDLAKAFSDRSRFLVDELNAIINAVHGGVIAVNSQGIITIFNHAAETITGISAFRAIGHPLEEIIPDAGLLNVLETGKPELGRKMNIGKSTVITNRTPIVVDKKIMGAVAIFQDITELQNIAQELESVKKLESTLQAVLHSTYHGIVVVDNQGIITMMNQAYGDFLGIDPQKAIGKHVTEVIENTRLHVIVKTGQAEIGEIQHIGGKQVVVSRLPIFEGGEIVGAVGQLVFKDIEDLKYLAKRLNLLENELAYYKEELRRVRGAKYTFDQIIGKSPVMEELKSLARKAAQTSSAVLILGESGTGKELFAQAIHDAGPRKHGPFIKVNCASIPAELIESELFGYEEGAFTGAKKGGKPGKFELANGGTIFLDEIGDMAPNMQAKLLRVLQEKEVERVGSTKVNQIDVRVIAATNRNLEAMIEGGQFRQDLYYRLNVISLYIPPLRERIEDIPYLVESLLGKLSREMWGVDKKISPQALELLKTYTWPGNVRELENVLERALNVVEGDTILPEHLPIYIRKNSKSGKAMHESRTLENVLATAEKKALLEALELAGGNKAQAAKILGIHRSGFYQKLAKYGLN